jgi:hypothetical protein
MVNANKGTVNRNITTNKNYVNLLIHAYKIYSNTPLAVR